MISLLFSVHGNVSFWWNTIISRWHSHTLQKWENFTYDAVLCIGLPVVLVELPILVKGWCISDTV